MNRTPWRVLVVDDEPLAREGVRSRLASLGGFEVVGECGSGGSAIAAIRSLSPDLVFLDVQMPGVDGFGVIERVGAESMPPVIFLTAHEQHALRAFDARAIDYLLKPIDDARFVQAVERARRQLADATDGRLGRRITDVLSEGGRTTGDANDTIRRAPSHRLVARDGNRVVVLDAGEVDWVVAEGDYVRLHVGQQSYLLRDTMGHVESLLPESGHVRIHRSTIVNLSRVRELQLQPNKEYAVVLRSGVKLKASRTYADRLRASLGIDR